MLGLRASPGLSPLGVGGVIGCGVVVSGAEPPLDEDVLVDELLWDVCEAPEPLEPELLPPLDELELEPPDDELDDELDELEDPPPLLVILKASTRLLPPSDTNKLLKPAI